MGDYLYKPAEIIRDKRLSPIEQDYLCLIAGLEKAGDAGQAISISRIISG